MDKIIGVLSFTGKVGKSTIVRNLLLPRMQSATLIEMETINLSSNFNSEQSIILKGREIDKLQNQLASTKSAVIDIGASNVESFMLSLTQQGGAHLDFDYFVVPIEANSAKIIEMDEAIKTINALSVMGVDPARIKVLFNKLSPDSGVEEEAKKIFNYHKKEHKFTLNPKATIHLTPAFKALGEVKKSYVDMLRDQTNYRAVLKEIPLEKEADRLAVVKLMRAQGCVQAIHNEFDTVFAELFGE